MQIHTGNYDTVIVLTKDDGIGLISIMAAGGTITVEGNRPFQGHDSTPITLQDTDPPLVFQAIGNIPVHGITITPGTGTIDIIIGVQ